MKMKTFKEYQASAVGMRVSLQRFLVEHPDLPEDVIELMGLTYDGLGLGKVAMFQGQCQAVY